MVPLRPTVAIPILLAVTTATGCARDGGWWPAAEIAPVARHIATAPAERRDLVDLALPEVVHSWDLADRAARDAWTVRGEGVEPAAAGLRVDPRRRGPRPARLVGAFDLDAGEIDALLISIRGRRSPALRVAWGPQGRPCRDGDLRQPSRTLPEEHPGVVRFPLLAEGSWEGSIRRLCITVLSSPQEATIERIALVRELYPPPTASESFRGRLGSETRPALFARRQPLIWPLEVPDDGRLELGFGVSGRGSARLRVTAVDRGRERELWAAVAGADSRFPAERWHDAAVDLRELAGRSVELRFEAEMDDDNRGLPLWGDPTVLAPSRDRRRPNLVLVSLDTLRPDHLSLYGYPRPTSPRIDRWAEGAVVFEQAITSAPWTLPAHLSMMTGLDAVRHGVNHRSAIPTDLELLAESLRRLGYQTVAVTGGGYMHPELGFDRGFDRYHFWSDRKSSDGEIRSTVDRAITWLHELDDRPVFLFVHSYETHHPYRFREPHFSRFFGSPPPAEMMLSYLSNGRRSADPDTLLEKWPARKGGAQPSRRLEPEALPMLVAAYDSGVAHADQEIGRLLARLGEERLAARTATVVTSDHGEALGEKGYASHLYLEDFNARVPLVLELPAGRAGGQRIATQVGVVDLHPTLLDLAGESPAPDLDGRSLLPLALGETAAEPRDAWTYASFSRRGIALRTDGGLKYMLNNSASSALLGDERLYDLRRDPDESDDLAADHPRTPELRRRALRKLADGAGVRLRMANPTAGTLRFLFSGSDVHPVRTKSATLGGDRLEWRDRQVAITLLPGDDAVLVLEGATGPRVVARIEEDGGATVRVALGEQGLPLRVALDGDRLVVGADGATVLDASWHGPAPVGDDAEAGGELEQQLEALGYLN